MLPAKLARACVLRTAPALALRPTALRAMSTPAPEGKTWGGRFTGTPSDIMEQFNASISVDKRMCLLDVDGSIVYAQALRDCGVLSVDQCHQVVKGLHAVRTEWEAGTFEIKPSDEVWR